MLAFMHIIYAEICFTKNLGVDILTAKLNHEKDPGNLGWKRYRCYRQTIPWSSIQLFFFAESRMAKSHRSDVILHAV